MLKRALDLLVIAAAMPLLIPLAAVIAAVIAVERNGPALYRSRRIGREGRPFDMLKFRTMYVDGDRRLTPSMREQFARDFKLNNDPRVTPVGRWLRRTSLDELPQIVNVLRGEMSLVGPRPKLPEEIELYGDGLATLLSVPPGLTGYWQVRRTSSNSDESMRRMDLEYASRRNLIVDIGLLVRTPWVVITGRNS